MLGGKSSPQGIHQPCEHSVLCNFGCNPPSPEIRLERVLQVCVYGEAWLMLPFWPYFLQALQPALCKKLFPVQGSKLCSTWWEFLVLLCLYEIQQSSRERIWLLNMTLDLKYDPVFPWPCISVENWDTGPGVDPDLRNCTRVKTAFVSYRNSH